MLTLLRNVKVNYYSFTVSIIRLLLITEGDIRVNVCHFNELDPREDPLTLEDILSFWTASSQVPVGGFHTTPSIIFLHSDDEVLATSSTCSLLLRLPIKYAADPQMFEEWLVLSIKGNLGFGVH